MGDHAADDSHVAEREHDPVHIRPLTDASHSLVMAIRLFQMRYRSRKRLSDVSSHRNSAVMITASVACPFLVVIHCLASVAYSVRLQRAKRTLAVPV
jgi:hypothetical protein